LIFGLHVHIGIQSHELAVELMNQLRTCLPHLLAMSSNSPCWAGRLTGLESYRSVIWKPFPRSGVPEIFPSPGDFDAYVQTLVQTSCIDDGKRIWWDIRPHPFFPTIEFRICDMPATFDDTIAIAALCQALVAKLTWLYKSGLRTPALSSHFIEENKWRVMHYGLGGELIDFVQGRRLGLRESISDLLDFVDEVIDDLGSRTEIEYLRRLLEDPRGTGADRQIALYEQTGSMDDVIQLLMQQTMQGIPVKVAPCSVHYACFNPVPLSQAKAAYKTLQNRAMGALLGGDLFEVDLLPTAAAEHRSSPGGTDVVDPLHVLSEHRHQVPLSIDDSHHTTIA
jgi:carboxylate-amine ligase